MSENEVFGAGEFRTTKGAQQGLIKGRAFYTKRVMYSAIEGEAILEGDIVLGTVRQLEATVKADDELFGLVIVGAGVRWPGGVIPYTIDAGLPDQDRVRDAISHWEEKTPIRFRQHSNETDYVTFRPGGGCKSPVGRRGGQQFVTLGPTCATGNVIHEIGHVVGLWHEQSREDRDSFIRLVTENIDPEMLHNFDQRIHDGDDVGAYDYGSIMHYPANAFALNESQPTIIPIGGEEIGQRQALSAGDIATVVKIYS